MPLRAAIVRLSRRNGVQAYARAVLTAQGVSINDALNATGEVGVLGQLLVAGARGGEPVAEILRDVRRLRRLWLWSKGQGIAKSQHGNKDHQAKQEQPADTVTG